jgi:hypothetical protein
MNKVLANKAFIEEILEERDNILGLSCSTIRGLKKLLKQPQPTPEEYSAIYDNRPHWVHTGRFLGAQTLTNPDTAIQMVWIDVGLIHQILAQSYHVFGLDQDTVLKLISTLETVFRQGIPTPEDYTRIYHEQTNSRTC